MTIQQPWTDVVAAATLTLKARDSVLASAIERVGPCTLVPDPNLFEALVDAIISQQISVQAADAIMTRLRSLLPPGPIQAQPLANLDVRQLQAIGLSSQKIRYVHDLCSCVLSGKLDLQQLPTLDDEAVIRALTAVRGVGRWTAEMILIFSLGRLDVWPVDDLGLAEGLRLLYNLEERPTRKAVLAFGERWRPYRTVATWYIWRIRRLSLQDNRIKTRIVSL
ncbi:DNA-3-methyladenine glycosylase family protein [Thermogemmatispora sp.]|uniref:DNA-3-methyladenine glycosylase family protein n=1 Tax=Thermogemmatispora sp. TaxID=1968838 RepID=UPI001D1D132C|nr:DNA-3-methyladenine glycosylase [Thermogemmatispora sp.]MBX5449105.1 DNA-3-methyladenine glycosylase 2 family protein [Thermogemmatispora sp.]